MNVIYHARVINTPAQNDWSSNGFVQLERLKLALTAVALWIRGECS